MSLHSLDTGGSQFESIFNFMSIHINEKSAESEMVGRNGSIKGFVIGISERGIYRFFIKVVILVNNDQNAVGF